ncbi:hypothetical protein AYM40_04865 [Paraburkholderia phytofirmans OLGA172]|uniref:Uncharacterized protein n=1 Tax=Paraburkholderia phytofirmans OLGA172 TaxID=1417228 RepID=A0A160FHV9_9BURK|nr:hypothetical protein AYM40_04865 [Paraburkholderia phytofirmans OLGA172]
MQIQMHRLDAGLEINAESAVRRPEVDPARWYVSSNCLVSRISAYASTTVSVKYEQMMPNRVYIGLERKFILDGSKQRIPAEISA